MLLICSRYKSLRHVILSRDADHVRFLRAVLRTRLRKRFRRTITMQCARTRQTSTNLLPGIFILWDEKSKQLLYFITFYQNDRFAPETPSDGAQ